LLPPRSDEARAALAIDQLEAGAAFHAAEHSDQALDEVGSLAQDLIDELVLAMGALEEAVFDAGLLGRSPGAVDQGLGLLLGELHELAPPDLEDVVDVALEGRPIGDGEVPLEDDAIEAGEHGDDQAGKLGGEARQRLHGVLLRIGAFSKPHSGARTPSLLILLGCGYAALGSKRNFSPSFCSCHVQYVSRKSSSLMLQMPSRDFHISARMSASINSPHAPK
jgi:hypothetical protein